MSRRNRVARSASMLALAALAACASTPATSADKGEDEAYKLAMEDAMRPASAEQIAEAERSDPLTRANFWANEYKKNPADVATIVSFMTSLRALGSHERIADVATTSLPIHPESYEIYLEFGRSLLANNKPQDAAQAFVRAADYAPATEAAPLAALGVAFDRMEMHDKAQEAYALALARDPNRGSTLSNYGMSLALTGQLDSAETQLRKAANLPDADVRIRQNLALVLGLQGRFDEMVKVDPTAPRRTIEANRTALRQMMIPTRSYEDLQEYDAAVVENARAPEQVMPDIREATVEEEALPEPAPINQVSMQADDLDGAATKPVKLRPKLRGSQGG